METYWDFTEKERSLMSEQDITALLDVELMTQGVTKVIAPTLRVILPVELATTTFYEVHGVIFKTAAEAQSFLNLKPMHSDYDYYTAGCQYKYPKAIDGKIEAVELYQHSDLIAIKDILTKNKVAKEFNEKAQTEYEKAAKAQEKVLGGVWDDWYRCKGKAVSFQKILDTKKEYLAMTNGDEALAIEFLKKIYTDEEIVKADEWFANRKGE